MALNWRILPFPFSLIIAYKLKSSTKFDELLDAEISNIVRTLFLLVFSISFLTIIQYVSAWLNFFCWRHVWLIGENGNMQRFFRRGEGGGGEERSKRKKVYYSLLKTENKYEKKNRIYTHKLSLITWRNLVQARSG